MKYLWTKRRRVTAAAALSLATFLVWDLSQEWSIRLNPDSRGYVAHEARRGWVYAAAIDALAPDGLESSGILQRGQFAETAPFAQLIRAQHVALTVALAAMILALGRFGALPPLLAIPGAGLLSIGLGLGLLDQLRIWQSSVNPEALIYPWLATLVGIALVAARRRRLATILFLGAWCALGVDLAPRLLPFAALSLAPLVAAIAARGPGREFWRSRELLVSAAAVLLCASLVGARCTANYLRYDSFAPAPYTGFTLIGVALQFAGPEDAERFEDPKIRKLAQLCLEDPRRLPTQFVQIMDRADGSFVNQNTWVIAAPHYQRLFGSHRLDWAGSNRTFADMSRELLFGDADSFGAWLDFSLGALATYFVSRWSVTCLAVAGLGLLAILLSGRSAHPALAVAAVLPLAHIGNAALSIPVQGILPRYMADSEWLLLILPALVAAWLVDRRARNSLDQSVDPFGATAV